MNSFNDLLYYLITKLKVPQNLILYRRLIIAAGWAALAALPIRSIRGSPGVDFIGDGTDDPGIFRGSTGRWAVKDITRLYFGQDGDLPVAGDYNGDGGEEMGIFRPETGLWAIRSVTRTYFGSSNDIAVQGLELSG